MTLIYLYTDIYARNYNLARHDLFGCVTQKSPYEQLKLANG